MEDIRTGLKLAGVAFCPHTAWGALWELINIHGFPIAVCIWWLVFQFCCEWPLAFGTEEVKPACKHFDSSPCDLERVGEISVFWKFFESKIKRKLIKFRFSYKQQNTSLGDQHVSWSQIFVLRGNLGYRAVSFVSGQSREVSLGSTHFCLEGKGDGTLSCSWTQRSEPWLVFWMWAAVSFHYAMVKWGQRVE